MPSTRIPKAAHCLLASLPAPPTPTISTVCVGRSIIPGPLCQRFCGK
jgi:hypothetical protein